MKKTLNIIPHSHWDREWYMGFEHHRFRLAELFDAIIDVMEKNPDYTYYHMDGQFIVIEDYLEIRPEMRDRLLALVKADRIQIGPWYVLQDEYLTSGEANVRNMLYGLKLCREFGASPVMCGYFPDAFGNISQAPQLLRGFGIDNAVFGRGLNDIGSNNEVVKQNGITNSELIWRSPDGSEVVGIMFANWYHNAMELPSDPSALKERIKNITDSTSRFAVTDQLLGMNGCDHQPLQKNLAEIIKLANKVQDDVTVIQSNFKDYTAKIKENKDKLAVFEGEIAGQLTTGNCLLINTASAHIDIKQQNQRTENILARIAEPLNSITHLFGDEYRSDFFLYAWRKLMQNHPHDSICTCSDDDVYTEMLARFKKAYQTADELRLAALDYVAGGFGTETGEDAQTNAKASARNIAVITLDPKKNLYKVKVNVDFCLDENISGFTLTDENGNNVPVSYNRKGKTFAYTLPKDRFRQPYYTDRFESELLIEGNGIGIRMLEIHPFKGNKFLPNCTVQADMTGAENSLIRIDFNPDGSFTLTDKRSGVKYPKQNIFEDVRDCGDLYNFIPVENDIPVTSDLPFSGEEAKADITICSITSYSVTYRVEIKININADIVTFITVTDGSDRVEIKTVIDNRAENHRIRALFGNGIVTDTVLAEGQFDLVRRNIQPWENWTNPSNTQRCENFFALEGNNGTSLLVSGRGLHEYEILRDGKNTMALTLLRCIGQIGDWGWFPTPLGQCKGEFTLEYAIVPYNKKYAGEAYSSAYMFTSEPCQAMQITSCKKDKLASSNVKIGNLISLDNSIIAISALKKCESRDSLILRLFNISDEKQEAVLTVSDIFEEAYETNLGEERLEKLEITNEKIKLKIGKKKIFTVELIRKN